MLWWFVFRLLNWVFRMGFPSIFSFFVVSHLVIVHSTWQDDKHGYQHGCPQSFNCGKLGPIKFPFSNDTYRGCGLCTVNCSEPVPIIYLGKDKPYEVKKFLNDEAVNVSDKSLRDLISSKSCDIFNNFTLFSRPSISYTISSNLTLFKCRTNSSSKPQLQTQLYSFSNCSGYTVYYTDPNQNTPTPANLSSGCVVIQLPMLPSIRNRNVSDLFSLLASEFTIGLHVSKECYECHHNGGQCHGHEEFHCIKDEGIGISAFACCYFCINPPHKLNPKSSVSLAVQFILRCDCRKKSLESGSSNSHTWSYPSAWLACYPVSQEIELCLFSRPFNQHVSRSLL
ncbi:LEAF RUST 10 DISEASE-RESISTANCE LOCUS RECEPTOR-LIKE PROTEIN KINASE-like 1.1 [Camellia sinensis]|uniref:LEAF RUST 10 DISEASE-RESISTANCE LOCUS RECEPTOR-LIKE PROTEIN KINASE-like 1.1 n=1 Tax=Camellia sinensis TaxID=4442 RepID=UPI00103658A5|nr:LEAF RUST 10 DISEASE-RESISTANCE LOCUS RECEPTOR-LIKE PROTEIN KINASE-like 1.1 [Camellia sinensis]